jgi:iron complex outermembrane recepter protein
MKRKLTPASAALMFLIILVTSAFNLNAQIIKGTIKSNELIIANESVELLNVKDSSVAKVEISNADGNFIFEGLQDANYLLHINAKGYNNYYSLANAGDVLNINLVKAINQMEGVKVTAKKPIIEVKPDKMVFNVEQSINATGSTALDMLRKSPGVTVDKDDNIALRSKNAVRIYIDGKPSYLDNKDLIAMLRTMQASDLESIEMITNPGAKFDASGNAGIINIKIKKNKKLGTNGSITAGYGIGKFPKYNTDLSLNYRNKKVNVFGTYGLSKRKDYNFINMNRLQNDTRFNQETDSYTDNWNNNIKVGADYFINKKHTVGVLANVMNTQGPFVTSSRSAIGLPNSAPSTYLVANNTIDMKRLNTNFNVNYKFEDTTGKSFTADVDYGIFRATGASYQPNYYYDSAETKIMQTNIYRNTTPTNINIAAAKIDYEQNLWKGKFGAGAKIANVATDNTFSFYDVLSINPIKDTLNLFRSNQFKYTETVSAAYVNYNRAINKKWSANAGLRYEYTNSLGDLKSNFPKPTDRVPRKYGNFFPSASLSYTPSMKHMFSMAYSRRIDRPNYQDLNPFENKLDELSYEKGNPFLRPQFTNNVELNYTFMQFASMGVSYARTTDLFMQVTDTTEQTRTYITQKNFASQDVINYNISSPLPIRKWWNGYMSLNYSYIILKANFDGRILNNKYGNFNLYLNNDFSLKNDWAINIGGWLNGPSYWGGIFRTKTLGSLDIGVQKQLMNKKLSLRASVSDVLYTAGWRATVNFGGMNMIGEGNYESRQLNVAATYKFGSAEIKRAREREKAKEFNRIK